MHVFTFRRIRLESLSYRCVFPCFVAEETEMAVRFMHSFLKEVLVFGFRWRCQALSLLCSTVVRLRRRGSWHGTVNGVKDKMKRIREQEEKPTLYELRYNHKK